MASQGKGEDHQHSADDKQATSQADNIGWTGIIQQQYRKIRENAETYPYVWGSYIVVYGGFGLWFAYRWRKLRRTEDRVRILQDRLRKLVEAENSTNRAVAEKAPPSAEKSRN